MHTYMFTNLHEVSLPMPYNKKIKKCQISGTDTTSDPGITNNVETTPKKHKVGRLTRVNIFCVYYITREW